MEPKSWPFTSTTGRATFGSPFSGYRGDYSVYPDETWKQGLRKYPYRYQPSPSNASLTRRRHRSASPRRSAVAQRKALRDMLAKV